MRVMRPRQAQQRRHRQEALELSDAVVQGLAVARQALERNESERATEAIDMTLATARKVITELLADPDGKVRSVRPGDLVRGTSVQLEHPDDDDP
jgi:succinate dehydrogenase/fumarate reductase flavoprotein subunit